METFRAIRVTEVGKKLRKKQNRRIEELLALKTASAIQLQQNIPFMGRLILTPNLSISPKNSDFWVFQHWLKDLKSVVVTVVQPLSHVRLCDPMDYSTPGFSVLHYLPELAQIHLQKV